MRAAGGVVWRRDARGELEVVVVHRPHYDDWSLPKGKVEPGESDREAARREVWEEAGADCELGSELMPVAYMDRKGQPKSVRYWAMTVAGGEIKAGNEVDVAEWLPIHQARARLSYERDREVLDSLTATL